ncbi:BQ2448_6979 [Microbotryum intermedium]|uniref:BQ2448_6979 protein n=1 Tax=Microbotryum intermedium TaxID=269621 RepID=A0A238FMF9_9BASI|nr:BQ2448_6979 [Microbotryum intermedium]
MSSLSGLVHLRTIDVPPQAKTLDDVEDMSLTTCKRVRRHSEPVAYDYSRPKEDARVNINLSVDHLKALCRLHGIDVTPEDV